MERDGFSSRLEYYRQEGDPPPGSAVRDPASFKLEPPPTASLSLVTSSGVTLERERGLWRAAFTSMGGPCELLCETDDESLAWRLARNAAREADRIDGKFCHSKSGTVVEALNASRGRPYRVDEETARLIEFGAKLWQLSNGAFDLTSGPLRQAWNFDEGLVAANIWLIPQLIGKIGWRLVGWEPPILTLPEGMEIDFDGIGKEYAVDLVTNHAASLTKCPVLVNFGGEQRCTGAMPHAGAWHVVNESFEAFGEAALRIELRSGALATSGNARRHMEIHGTHYGDIFDARTGWPALDAPRSITVAAATCSQAGSYSTLAMLKGAGAEAFLEAESVQYWCLR